MPLAELKMQMQQTLAMYTENKWRTIYFETTFTQKLLVTH